MTHYLIVYVVGSHMRHICESTAPWVNLRKTALCIPVLSPHPRRSISERNLSTSVDVARIEPGGMKGGGCDDNDKHVSGENETTVIPDITYLAVRCMLRIEYG